jgi:Tol biopolymer transport system component
LVFGSSRAGTAEIFKIRSTPPYGRPVRLTFTDVPGPDPHAIENLAPAWSPDGGTIAFTRRTYRPGGDSPAWIGRMRPDGSHLRFDRVDALPIDGGPHALSWGPGGVRIAWLYLPGTPSGEDPVPENIWRSRPDGSHAVQLTDYAYGDAPLPLVDGPSWSPRGTRIVYSAEANPGYWDPAVFRLAADGSGEPTLIAEYAREPDWGVRPR